MGVFIYLMAILPAYGISPCNWNTVTLNTENPPNSGIANHYHCLTLNASGNITVQGRHPLLIYVEGDTNISATIDLNGSDGVDGGLGSYTGGGGGPGGFSGGGVANFYDTNGGNGEDGGYGGGGGGGNFGTAPISEGVGGGGGSGGRLGVAVVSQGSTGSATSTAPNIILGAGGITGANNLTAELFQSRFSGGPGGGAGGSGENFGNASSGGSGGGGGGAVRLYSKGNILFTGTITANGGDGGDGGWDGTNGPGGGGGGGGAGGAIYFASMEDITINNGTLRAEGGSAGTGGNNGNIPEGGDGGLGSAGAIRLDDQDGQITVTSSSTIAPSPRISQFHLVHESDISVGCGGIDTSRPPWSGALSFTIGFALIVLMMGFLKRLPRYSRLK